MGKEIKGIYKTENDPKIEKLFSEIKNTFSPSKLTSDDDGYNLEYEYNNSIIKLWYLPADITLIPSYSLKFF